jgi:hypothetical protein
MYIPPLIELHEVPGICTGDENCVLFCPSCPELPRPHENKAIEYAPGNKLSSHPYQFNPLSPDN